jgi:hypothetical protein
MRLARAACCVIALIGLTAAAAAGALGGARVYKNPQWRVRGFEVPRGFEWAPQSSYPAVLLLAVGPEGARLSLAAQRVARGVRAHGLAEAAAVTLARQGFLSPRVSDDSDGRARLEAAFDGGRSQLRQIYAVDGDLGFVVSLSAPTARLSRLQRELDEAARSLQIAPQGEPPPDGGAEPPDAK